jgi:hypothetical protein
MTNFQGFPKPVSIKKKRKGIRKVGKIGKRNMEANQILHKLYAPLNLPPCEAGIPNLCWNETHGYMHRHGRVWYRSHPELLHSVNQTLRGCNPCHTYLDAHRKDREALFMKRRGLEL